MLLQFMMKNVLSFKEESVLDMTAVTSYKEHPCNLMEFGKKEKAVRVAAIYGANASGKSNVCFAMHLFQSIVRKSFNTIKQDSFSDNEQEVTAIQKYYKPFAFDKNKDTSEFEIIFVAENKEGNFEYKYGFEYNDTCIVSEWMYRKNFATGRTVTIYERNRNKMNFGPAVRKDCDGYKNQIPEETLVLSFFQKLKLNTTIFETVYSKIMEIYVFHSDFKEDSDFLNRTLPVIIDTHKEKLLHFLSGIDTGIKDIEYLKEGEHFLFFTYHKGKDEKNHKINLFSESDGTIKSIWLFIIMRFAILTHRTIFADELNNKLHPLLLKFIVDLFYDVDSTAQLIYTTHDTTLLDRHFFRRDQIWFVQKDEFGYSQLTSLSDFKVRSDSSFEKDYLSGVYGGIPSLHDFEMKGEK